MRWTASWTWLLTTATAAAAAAAPTGSVWYDPSAALYPACHASYGTHCSIGNTVTTVLAVRKAFADGPQEADAYSATVLLVSAGNFTPRASVGFRPSM